jgi:uridine kinase
MDFYLTDKPRESVELTLSDGRIITGKRGGRLEDFVRAVQKPEEPLVVGAILDGQLRELTYPVGQDGRATLLTMQDSDGARIYRRSLVFLLEVAFKSCFPEGELNIDHSVSSGGYYCEVSNLPHFGQEELDRIKVAMQDLVDQDVPFVRETVPLEEAIAYFTQAGEDDKVKLLKYRKRPDLVLYRAGETRDYHHGYMVPSSGYLKWFDFYLLDQAFIIRFPRRHAPSEVLPMESYPPLLRTFKAYGDWLTTLGIHSVGSLNDAIQEGHIDEVILVSEALHEMEIAQIAAQIYEARDRVSVILIAGPSSSGKTTFSKRLGIQLLAKGITPFALEMDNFFIDRDKTPLNPDGHRDYESLRALDLVR